MKNWIARLIKGMAFALALCLLPVLPLNTASAALSTSPAKVVDPSTKDTWENLFVLHNDSNLNNHSGYAGSIWTDKSVYADGDDFGEVRKLVDGQSASVTLEDENSFLVSLSAMASTMEITGYSTTPTDTMLVLDVSGSMVGASAAGYRNSNGTDSVMGANEKNIPTMQAMVDAANAAMDKLLALNKHNRVGLVLYSGGSGGNATLVLPLGRYSGINGEYITMEQINHSEQLYVWSGRDYNQRNVTYTTIHVSVTDGLRDENGNTVTDVTRDVVGATYIQGGMYTAWEQFESRINAGDTVVEDGKIQGGTRRMPIMVLMSDGAPTKATKDYSNVGNADVGDGRTSDATPSVGFVTQLTASWIRAKMEEGYKTSPRFYTLGLGDGSRDETATGVLNPSSYNNNASGYWDTFLSRGSVTLEFPNESLNSNNQKHEATITRENGVNFVKNYVDRYWGTSNADEMTDAFNQIVVEIELQSKYYATLIANGERDIDGYITIEDEIGEFMEVKNVIGLSIGDTLYSGEEMGSAMTRDVLGSAGGSSQLGDELVWTVQERLGIENLSEARELVGMAYNYHQLCPGSPECVGLYDPSPNGSVAHAASNYIGWYGDANNNYLGHWHEGHTEADYEPGAQYINRSYGYLGDAQDSNLMHIVVMVHTNIETGDQSVLYKIPASLIPMVTYSATVDTDSLDTASDITLTNDAATSNPLRLLLEVGLRDDINEVTLAEIMENADHSHSNNDGSYSFYTNRWSGTEWDDPETHTKTTASFTPSTKSEYYYFNEDEYVLDSNGQRVRLDDIDRSGNTQYYYDRWAFQLTGSGNKAQVFHQTKMPLDEMDIANFVKDADGYAYIPAGSWNAPADEMVLRKSNNLTGTLDYSFYSRGETGNSAEEFFVYDYLGNNGTFRLTPATGLKLTKTVTQPVPGAPDSFQFTIALTDGMVDAGSVSVTDEAGNPIETGWSVNGQMITVTLSAGQTVCIIGLPAGATYTVTEAPNAYYSSSITPATGMLVGQELIEVNAENAPYGSLVIEKDVIHPFGGNTSNLFDFTAQIYTLTQEEANAVTIPAGASKTYANGTLTVSGIRIADNHTAILGNIPLGADYAVTEQAEPGFTLTTTNDDTGKIVANPAAVAQFINTYTATPIRSAVTVSGTKKLVTNVDDISETFTFKVQKWNGTAYEDVPGATANATVSSTVGEEPGTAAYTIALNGETFTEPGTHYYQIVEVAGSTEKMTYDLTSGRFSVTITDEGMVQKGEPNGVLLASISRIENVAVNGLTVTKDFVNTYNADDTNVAIAIRKQLNNAVTGYDIPLNTFRFELLDENKARLDPPVQVSANMAGEALITLHTTQAGTQVYYLKEIPGTLAGMSYDPAVHKIEIVTEDMTPGILSSSVYVDGVLSQTLNRASVAFENSYEITPVSVNIPASKTLMNLTSNPGEPMPIAQGEFQLQYIQVDAAFNKIGDWTTVPFGANDLATGDLTGDAMIELLKDCREVGTFRYIVQEVPGNRVGYTYDPATWHVTIITSVDEVDGRMIETHTINKVGGGTAESIAFENTYVRSGTASVPVGGMKTLTGRDLNPQEFSFELLDAGDRVIQTVQNHADGSFAFEDLVFTSNDIGAHTYTVRERKGQLGGVTYTDLTYTFTVDVADAGDGTITATVRDLPAGQSLNFEFANTYSTRSATVNLGGTKKLTGRELKDHEFAFELIDAATGNVIETVQNVGDRFAFSTLTYRYTDENSNDLGTHRYVIREKIPEDAQKLAGVSYDATTYRVTVTVSDLHGTMTARTAITTASGNTVDEVVFTNAYAAQGEAQVSVKGLKELQGRALAAGEFSFELVDVSGQVIRTESNQADGSFVFDLVYSEDDIGSHAYTIREKTPEDAQKLPGVSYSEQTYPFVVQVSDVGDGMVAAVVTGLPTEVKFINTYSTKSVTVALGGAKTLTGRALADGEFAFELVNAATNEVIETVQNADGRFAFTALTYGYVDENTNDLGVHNYIIREKVPQDAQKLPGVTYDNAVYQVAVTVTDQNGAMNATVEVTGPDGQMIGADEIAFHNTYNPNAAVVYLEGTKAMSGKPLGDEVFAFQVFENGSVVATGHNDATGRITFTPINIEKAGSYSYTVTEEIPQDAIKKDGAYVKDQIAYDSAVFSVTVMAYDDGSGKLSANVTYSEPIAFTNVWQPTPISITLQGTKKLVGRDLADGEFCFSVLDSAGTCVATGSNNRNGRIVFTPIELPAEGRYSFTVAEEKGDAANIVYDDRSFAVTVDVTTENGMLKAAVTHPDGEPVFENVAAPDLPQTGDNSHIGLRIALTLVSLVGIATMLTAGRRRGMR